jgi:hypothetical protein
VAVVTVGQKMMGVEHRLSLPVEVAISVYMRYSFAGG